MDVFPLDLLGAAHTARDRFWEASRTAATMNTGHGAGPEGRLMAAAARSAIFADALISALHARLEELKTVTK